MGKSETEIQVGNIMVTKWQKQILSPQSLYHPKNLKYLTSATQVSAAQNNNYLTNKISPQLTTAGLTYLLS